MYARRVTFCVFCRSFAVRRIRDGFRANKSLVDAEEIEVAYDKAITSYELLQRQVSSTILFTLNEWQKKITYLHVTSPPFVHALKRCDKRI